jgi:hypothetical protein
MSAIMKSILIDPKTRKENLEKEKHEKLEQKLKQKYERISKI